VQTIPFGEDVAPAKSYLNDVRVDTVKTQTALSPDSGLGAIVVVDLRSGKARRLLADDHSDAGGEGFQTAGRRSRDAEDGKSPQIHSDGIAPGIDCTVFYYHALSPWTSRFTGIKTADLRNSPNESQLARKWSIRAGKRPRPMAWRWGLNGKLYLTDVEHGAITLLDPQSKSLAGDRGRPLELARTAPALGTSGDAYVTTSRIQEMPCFNGGSRRIDPHMTFTKSSALAVCKWRYF